MKSIQILQRAKLEERKRKCGEEGDKKTLAAAAAVDDPREDNGSISSAVETRFQGHCRLNRARTCFANPLFAAINNAFRTREICEYRQG